MELVSVRVAESPYAPDRVRLVGDVAYDDRPGQIEPYWFDVPREYADSLSVSGNPWLACLLPLAATRGETLRLRVPVDPLLLESAPRITRMWSEWYRDRFPEIRAVAVEADVQTTEPRPGPRESAAFFSGGIDSFYMVLRDAEARDRGERSGIDRLICVWGFDVPLRAPREFARLRSRLAAAASDLGKELLDVSTNLKVVRFREARWGNLSHGCALASVGLALEPRFHSLHIAGTHSDGPLKPWGSHPETDPLLSTSITRLFHDGASIARSEKTEYVSRSDVAMRNLHVCYAAGSSENCCNCRKCYLAMLNLEVLGALSRCATLRAPDLARVDRIYVRSPAYERLYRDIAVKARAAGRDDIARAIGRCLSRSRRLKRELDVIEWLSRQRGLWRIARRFRPRVLAGSVL